MRRCPPIVGKEMFLSRVMLRIYVVFLCFLTLPSLAEPDDLLVQASEQARSSLPVFWHAFEANGGDPYTFEIKAKVAFEDGSSTIAWIGKLKRKKGGDIEGSIVRGPERLEYHSKFNSTVRFTNADVLDWGYRYETEQSAKIYGHFTTRLMLGTMPIQDQKMWKNTLSLQPLPPSAINK